MGEDKFCRFSVTQYSFWQFKVYADIRGFPWRDGVRQRYIRSQKRQSSVLSVAMSSEFLNTTTTLLYGNM